MSNEEQRLPNELAYPQPDASVADAMAAGFKNITNADVSKMDQDCGLSEFHVLVVDDSNVDRMVVKGMVKKICCCKVTVAESGMRALQYLGLELDAGEKSKIPDELKEFDMVITDYEMPGMTGFELLKKIKGSSKLSKIPVVIMSSDNIEDRVAECIKEGAERFLVKPVKESDVQTLKDCFMNSASTSDPTTIP